MGISLILPLHQYFVQSIVGNSSDEPKQSKAESIVVKWHSSNWTLGMVSPAIIDPGRKRKY